MTVHRRLFRDIIAPGEVVRALLSADGHVYRQQGHGKHEQDRADAVSWIAEFGPLVEALRRARS